MGGHWKGAIQGQIQLQRVDARFTEDAVLWTLGIGGDKGANRIGAGMACRGHPADLGFRTRRTDIRIETAAGSRNQIGWHRAGKCGVLLPEFLDVPGHPRGQRLVGRTQVRAARSQTVIGIKIVDLVITTIGLA